MGPGKERGGRRRSYSTGSSRSSSGSSRSRSPRRRRRYSSSFSSRSSSRSRSRSSTPAGIPRRSTGADILPPSQADLLQGREAGPPPQQESHEGLQAQIFFLLLKQIFFKVEKPVLHPSRNPTKVHRCRGGEEGGRSTAAEEHRHSTEKAPGS